MSEDEAYETPIQVALRLGTTKAWIGKMIHEGRLPAKRVGYFWRIPVGAVIAPAVIAPDGYEPLRVAAQRLGVSVMRAHDLIKDERLPAIRVGSRLYVPVNATPTPARPLATQQTLAESALDAAIARVTIREVFNRGKWWCVKVGIDDRLMVVSLPRNQATEPPADAADQVVARLRSQALGAQPTMTAIQAQAARVRQRHVLLFLGLPPAGRIIPQGSGRPVGSGPAIISVRPHSATVTEVAIGRAVWRRIGAPERVSLAVEADRLVIRAAAPDAGYALNQHGMPRCHVVASQVPIPPGTYAAESRDDAIFVAIPTRGR